MHPVRIRRPPRDRRRIPNLSSPRVMGSTTSSRSFFRSQSTTSVFGVGFVGSLRTFASTVMLEVLVNFELGPSEVPDGCMLLERPRVPRRGADSRILRGHDGEAAEVGFPSVNVHDGPAVPAAPAREPPGCPSGHFRSCPGGGGTAAARAKPRGRDVFSCGLARFRSPARVMARAGVRHPAPGPRAKHPAALLASAAPPAMRPGTTRPGNTRPAGGATGCDTAPPLTAPARLA